VNKQARKNHVSNFGLLFVFYILQSESKQDSM